MTNTRIAYGDEFNSARLPERTQILEPPSPFPLLKNPEQAIRDALYSTIAHDPISKLVGPKSKVTIAFDDPVIPQVPMKKPDFREMAITILLEELEKAGVKINERGFITVNKYMETTAKNIWALGDVAGVYLFKHSANLEAEYVLNNLWGKREAVDYYPMPHAIFTNPQIAGVGMTEQEAREKKKEYVIGRYEYKNIGMGAAIEEKDSFVKFIVDRKSKEILGCHIIGPDASTLIHEVVVAMKADRKKALGILREAVHVHPGLSEVVQRAARSVPV